MALVAILALTVVSLVLIRLLVAKSQRHITKPRVVRHSGCEDPPSYAHKDQFGKDLYELSIEASKHQRFLDFTEELFDKHGKTFQTINDGKVWIKTRDPELSKAIYSTFFEKFGLQPIRYEEDGFFGNGILVVDGGLWKRSRGLIRPAFEIAHVANFDRLHRHVGRFLEILPRDSSTVDLLPDLKRLVSAHDPVIELPQSDNECYRPSIFPPSSSSANLWMLFRRPKYVLSSSAVLRPHNEALLCLRRLGMKGGKHVATM